MRGHRTNEEWIAQYARSHRHPVNRFCHTLGIPMIAASLPLFVLALLVDGLGRFALALFLVGWTFQFVGHAFERTWPEFFHDPRFLFVGLRWWWAKVRGQEPGAATRERTEAPRSSPEARSSTHDGGLSSAPLSAFYIAPEEREARVREPSFTQEPLASLRAPPRTLGEATTDGFARGGPTPELLRKDLERPFGETKAAQIPPHDLRGAGRADPGDRES
jgi:hypothetical protein